ncbi:MAG TPA: hypothetical protein VF862_09765 [Gemmatimonadales bacterium]
MRNPAPPRLFPSIPVLLGLLVGSQPLAAQYDRPPEQGGRVFRLGMPPIWKGNAGATVGWYDRGGEGLLQTHGHLGLMRDIGSPIVGIAAIGAEGYGGYRGDRSFNGGVRGLFSIPSFRVTTGVDYNISDQSTSGIIRVELATRRSGIFGGGSMLRLEWFPGHRNTFQAGVNVPLWGRNIGATRPQRDAVELEQPPVTRMTPPPAAGAIDSQLVGLRAQALRIARLATPLADHGGDEPAVAHAPDIAAAREALAGGSPADAQRAWHAALDRLFTTAAGSPSAGIRIAAEARRVLLDEVLLPYNGLLGQRKAHDRLTQFAASATSAFAHWALRDATLPAERFDEVGYALQGLMDVAEATRAFQRERWEDARLVWLPLQLALREEDYDTQSELNALIERATNARFTSGNRLWYVMNEAFQLEFARSVFDAEDYHVLWIHDYRGLNGEKRPDRVGFAQSVDVYLGAMTRRIREYDRTGRLPQYFIFLDQNYFEANGTRLWFRLLQDPLDATLDLPGGFEAMEREFVEAQAALRKAVAESRVLQAERRQYGDTWLKDRIRVHINITNPADPSFVSNHVAGILPVPDNVIRDHRKIAFYDLTEADPYRGLAMYTGMGIGEHYAGANWEDRAVMIQGPAALGVKDAARQLLEQQGFRPHEIPLALRAKPLAANWQASLDSSARAMQQVIPTVRTGLALQLHNQTGYAAKPINVEKAILYSLMPPGSVLKIPDSLWQNYLFASLLTGSALRGCKVLIIAPSLASAPSAAAPTMARAHGLMSSLLVWRREFAGPIEARGGLLRVGLYAPKVGVGDLAGRIRQGWMNRPAWLDGVTESNPAVAAVIDSLSQILDAAGYQGTYLVGADSLQRPKLHLKANALTFIPPQGRFASHPGWARVVREYVLYLAAQGAPPEQRRPARESPAALTAAVLDLIRGISAGIPPEDADRWISYFTIGSANMDYRSLSLDGEVQVTMTHWNTLAGLVDFTIIEGLSEWPETQAELDRLLPPPSGFARSMANLIRLLL